MHAFLVVATATTIYHKNRARKCQAMPQWVVWLPQTFSLCPPCVTAASFFLIIRVTFPHMENGSFLSSALSSNQVEQSACAGGIA